MPIHSYTVREVALQIDPRSLNAGLEESLASGRYESSEANALQRLLRPADVYFELGGGVGFLSVLAWRIVNDPDRIHVYEANPELLPVIERTWQANKAKGRLYNWMLGKGKGTHEFNLAKAFWASSGHVDYGNARKIEVEQRDFLKQLDKRAATFVMMDIEGGETDLLDQVLPARVRAVVAEYHPRIIGEERVQALWTNLESQGFQVASDASEGKVRAYLR